MTIGEALKKERKDLGLTQTEMAGDILTKSYYSKVVDLIEILRLHDIDISRFFSQIETNQKINNEEYISKLHRAYYHKNLEQLSELQKQLKKEVQTSEILNFLNCQIKCNS